MDPGDKEILEPTGQSYLIKATFDNPSSDAITTKMSCLVYVESYRTDLHSIANPSFHTMLFKKALLDHL